MDREEDEKAPESAQEFADAFQDMLDQGAIEKIGTRSPEESDYMLNLKAVELLLQQAQSRKKPAAKPDPEKP